MVLLGPRQVGKTTLLLQLIDSLLQDGFPSGNLTYFDFSDDRLTGSLSPREVVQIVPTTCQKDHPRIFFFDEISRSKHWDAWLKQAVDTTEHRYLVTDSAASLLREGTVESGLGRWDEHHVEGLSFTEFLRLMSGEDKPVQEILGKIPNALARYLILGGFPEHLANPVTSEIRRRLRSDIADRAILRDLARRKVRDLERIRELFVCLVQDSGAILDVRARAEALKADTGGADPRSVRSWVRILEETQLLFHLPRLAGSPMAKLKSSSRLKVYASDHGLIFAFSASADPLLKPRDRGRIFEAVVFRHLRALAQDADGSLAYFRRDEDHEIDFILDSRRERIGIEVTASRDPDARKVGRLRHAGQLCKADRLFLIHDGFERKGEQGIEFVSIQKFLLTPMESLKL
ncbi:MAG: ATP-binding protein [Planctomycetes bacterium]|nr:ATP-binding protein [Planctomycetota bacterium]